MRLSSQLLLTFLLNAAWQIPLLAAAATLGSWLLRETSARYRHWLWTIALLLSVSIPAVATVRSFGGELLNSGFWHTESPGVAVTSGPAVDVAPVAFAFTNEATPSSYLINRYLAFALIAVYLLVVGYRGIKLIHAWQSTRVIRRNAVEIRGHENVRAAIERCGEAFREKAPQVAVLSSSSIHVPITIGLVRPVIILPDELLADGSLELLTSAIGHEFIHVARRDYFFNLVYELLHIPFSFHPAAGLIRRRIRQTRELCCDELVAERILRPEVYARSLVKLASSAPSVRRLSVTTTVGIADADILEARIMSLLKKPKLDKRWKKISLIAVSLSLLVPCLAAAAFAMRFEVQPSGALVVQEPQEKDKDKDKDKEKEKVRQKLEESREFREGRLAGEAEAKRTYVFTGDEFELRARRQEEELKARSIMQAALMRLTKIQMDQAIQIATSQQPGKVLECTLNYESGEQPSEGRVVYHVVVLSGDEASPVVTHVMVNGIDGTVIKAEKELPRKMRRPEQP